MKAIGKNSVSTILKIILMGLYGLQWLAVVILLALSAAYLFGAIDSPNIGLDISLC